MIDNELMMSIDDEEYENILNLANMVEADLMEKLLSEHDISCYIRPWQDVGFDGIFVERKGYAWLIGRRADEDIIRRIYQDCIQPKKESNESNV